MANPRSPDWRNIGDESSAPAPASARPWQPGDAPESTAPGNRQGLKRAVALLALLLVLIGIGWVLVILRKPQPAVLLAAGSGYEQNLLVPHNIGGWNGLIRLLKNKQINRQEPYFPWAQPIGMRKFGDSEDPIELRQKPWKDIWNSLNVKSQKEKTLVLFMSAHGLAESDDVYLVPNIDSLRELGQAMIPFKEIVQLANAASGKKVVLFLDVNAYQPHWLTATQKYDFVERLKFNYEDKLGNLVVVTAASPNERAWTSEELHNSVFLHYATQGLLGDAIAGERGVIKLSKLYDYVADRVDQWARTHRARTQRPLLLGKASAKDDIDLVYIDTPYAPRDEPATPFNPEQVKPEWDTWERLRSLPAQAYSPHLWRQYQDTLVRYEQVMRCGDPTGKGDDLKRTLKSLEKEISEDRPLTAAFDAMTASFAMHRVLGYPAPQDRKALALLVEQYRKSDGDEKKRLELLEPIKKSASRDQQLTYALFGAALLEKPAGYQQDHATLQALEKALGLAGDTKSIRPVELQLHTMLQYADPGMKDLLPLAVQVQRLAEETALSIPVGAGQGSVAYSEAILHWIRKDIEAADRERRQGEDLLFGDPAKHAEDARKALENARKLYQKARQQASDWRAALSVRDEVLAELPYLGQWLASAPISTSPMQEMDELRPRLEVMGDDVATLTRLLVPGKSPPDPPTTLTKKIAKAHGELRERFETIARRAPEAANQRNWHEIDHALSIPYADAERRIELLGKLKKISAGLRGIGEPEALEDARARVARQRDIAARVLAATGLYLDEPNFDRLREFYQSLADRIVEHTRAKLEKRKPLQMATDLCRLVPPGIVRANAGEPFHPPQRLRRLQAADLLYWQADRVCKDHWFDGDADRPYFRNLAKASLTGTLDLLKGDSLYPDLLLKVEAFEKQEFAEARLEIQGAAKTQPWTTEPEYPMPWKVTKKGTLPEGKAMVWVDLPGLPRRVVEWSQAGHEAVPFPTLKEAEVWGKNPTKYGTVSLQAIYRGQLVHTDIAFHRPPPDATVRQDAAPPQGNLAVRRDPSFDYGAVSIVLDTSGSMNWVPLKNEEYPKAGELSRFDYALKAMDVVLNKIPNNTLLSVFRFKEDVNNPKYGAAVETLREPAPWQRFGKQALRSDLQDMSVNRKKYLKGGSPIADAIVRSMKEGFPADYRGPRVILVLTDGSDNDSVDAVQDRLQRAGVLKSDIDVMMVCFVEADSREYLDARKQFAGIREITAEREGDKLGQTILSFLHPQVQLVDKASRGEPVLYDVGVEKPEWKPAAAGTHLGKIRRTDSQEVDVIVRPGDNLFVMPKRINGRFVLERGLLAEQPKEIGLLPRRPQARGDWLVAMFSNRITGSENILKQLITIEKRPDSAAVIEQVYPGFVWLELKGITEKDRSGKLAWWNSWDVAAPAYRVERDNWPTGLADPTLTSWFWPESREAFMSDEGIVRPFKLESRVTDDKKLFEIQSVEWNVTAKKLVLRAAFTPGAPVLFALRNPASGVSVQHDYYSNAGRVTAYFEGVSASLLGTELLAIDVNRFKESSRTQNVVFETRVPPSYDPPEYFLRPRK